MALIELRNGRVTESSIELRDVQEKIDDTASRTETRKRLLYESEVTAPKLLSGRRRRVALQPDFTIIHQDQGRSVETPAQETSELAPGDTVKVTMPLPDDLDEGDDAASAAAQAPTVQ